MTASPEAAARVGRVGKAPTVEVDVVDVDSGVAAAITLPAAEPAPPVPDRRSDTRLAQLTRLHDDLCTQAVDSFEIAAGLESAGVSDRQARTLYGAASVFELASAMFALVPRRPSDRGAPADRWHRPVARHLLRGLLYGLPGLLYAVAYARLQPGAGPVFLLAATIVACGVGQGVSVLGHLLLGRGELRAARTLLAGALALGVALLAALPLLGLVSPSILPAALLAGIQLEYLLAATVLLLLDADRVLLGVLAPGVLLAAAELAGLVDSLPQAGVLGLLVLCPIGALIAAAMRLARRPAGSGRPLREVLAGAGAVRSLTGIYIAYGAANAGLVAFAVVDVLMTGDDRAGGPIVLMMLPLVASLGIAEWLVHRLRSGGTMTLHETRSAQEFRRQAASLLGRAIAGYAAVLAALGCAIGAAYAAAVGGVEPGFVLGTAAYSVLGVAFLLETLLLSLGRHGTALALAGAALIVDSVLRWPLASQPAVAMDVMHLAVFTALLAALIPITVAQFTSVGMHR